MTARTHILDALDAQQRHTAIETADLLDWLRERQWLVENGYIPKAHAVFCDPPYGLAFMNQHWDTMNAHEFQAWVTEWASLMLSFVHPGAVLLCFGGTRTFHRLAAGLEDAGWIITDMMAYMYGSGFPKSHDISKAIDKKRHDDIRPVCRFLRGEMEKKNKTASEIADYFGFHSRMVEHWAARDTDSQPSIPKWDQWLKLKAILQFGSDMDAEVKRLNDRKNEVGESWRNAEIIGEYDRDPGGFGEHRFNTRDNLKRSANTPAAQRWQGYGTALKPAWEPIIVARAPFRETYAQLAQQYGTGAINVDGGRILTNETLARPFNEARNQMYGKFSHFGNLVEPAGRWPANLILGCTCEGDEHRADCAVALLDAQSGESGYGRSAGAVNESIATRGKPGFPGLGISTPGINTYDDTGTASRFFYTAKASTFERSAGLKQRSIHPTMKPITLTEYLARLILPPPLDTPRRLLIPFSGVASEMIGALLAGWDQVIGIEQSAEYAAIGRQRIAWWSQFRDYEQAKRAWDADQGEEKTRDAERALGLEQLALFAGEST